MKKALKAQHYNAGVTLVEVLVALLVLGIGIMGFVGLQMKAVDTTETTYSRSQAMAIARDLIERINANPMDWVSHYGEGSRWNSESIASASSCYGAGVSGSRNRCDSGQMAAWDVYEVRTVADQMLYQGKVAVRNSCANAGVPCVVVAWEGTEPANCDPESFAIGGNNANSNCVKVEFWTQTANAAQIVAEAE